jgi:hypothetical protein
MLIPNNEYVIIKVDRTKVKPGEAFEGVVYSVGQQPFAPQPVGGDGRNFSFARQPDPFPIQKGDRVIAGSYITLMTENEQSLAITYKAEVYAIIKDEQEEINLFNQEMMEDTNPQLLKG